MNLKSKLEKGARHTHEFKLIVGARAGLLTGATNRYVSKILLLLLEKL